jgi:hypothetical protein
VAGGPILSFDVGGSFVKAGLVDVAQGRLAGEVLRRATPSDAAPGAVMDLLAAMAQELPSRGRRPTSTSAGSAPTRAHCSRRAWAGRWPFSTMRMPPVWRRWNWVRAAGATVR